MQVPPGKVCRLHRALYGLKQAPRAWFAKFCTTISNFGFTSISHDFALFVQYTKAGIILLLLHVDDIIITGDDTLGILQLKSYLHKQFEMKDLGSLTYFLAIKVTRGDHGYYLSQVKYTSDLLSRAQLTGGKVAPTPLEYNMKPTLVDGTLLENPTLYHQLVGSLVYLTITRPDIAYVVYIISQFMADPRTYHYATVLRMLHYLKGTIFHGLYFSSNSSFQLLVHIDANWADDPMDQ